MWRSCVNRRSYANVWAEVCVKRFDRREIRHLALAAVLIAAFLIQSFAASLQKSPVFDEPPHIAAGMSYVGTHIFNANLQHPPLLKEMSALSLLMAGMRWPSSADAEKVTHDPTGDQMAWSVGVDIIARNGANRTIFWARLPFFLLGGLLGALIYIWGRELVGPTAALGALFLYALDPTIIAHSSLVTTDVGVTAFIVLFLFTLWRFLQRPCWPRVMWCGLALGAALGAKFSAAFLVPTAALLLFVAARWPAASPSVTVAKKRAGSHRGARASVAAEQKRAAQHVKLVTYAGAFAAMCGIAAIVIEALYFFPRNPFLYFTGLQQVNADHSASFQAYFHGAFATRFYGYFAAAYLLKEPLATIALTMTGLVVLYRRASVTAPQKWFLLLTPAVFVLAVTLFADDLGIRYIIPALPFAHLLGGLGLTSLWHLGTAWSRPLVVALCAWAVVAAAGIYPDHLSYFNESACLLESPAAIGWDGGTRCGPLWLDDSNVDWGQGLKQLRTWIDRNAPGRVVRLGYFGVFPPEQYGLRVEPIGEDALMAAPTPGLYAVSAHGVARFAGSWLRRLPPVAIVGHAFYIYDVR
jgi:hypothetical protein